MATELHLIVDFASSEVAINTQDATII